MPSAGQAKVEKFFSLLAAHQHPRLRRGLNLSLNLQSRYIFQARKNGRGVQVEVGFLPGAPSWEAHFNEMCRASLDILTGRTEAVGHARLNAFEVSMRQYRQEVGLANAGYYLPREHGL